MNIRIQSVVLSTVVLLGVSIYLPGCATTGMDRATKTTDSMQMVENDYRQAILQIDATNASLENLFLPSQTDTRKAYDAYAKNATKMEDLGKRLDMHTEKMETQRDAYFAEWESSYTHPGIQKLSEQRRIEMREVYAKIPEASIGVKGALNSYLTDIREIRRYLSNDLTPQGIESIRPIAQTAINDGDRAKEAIKPLLTAIDQVRSKMTQGE